jgi:hypothetical protein
LPILNWCNLRRSRNTPLLRRSSVTLSVYAGDHCLPLQGVFIWHHLQCVVNLSGISQYKGLPTSAFSNIPSKWLQIVRTRIASLTMTSIPFILHSLLVWMDSSQSRSNSQILREVRRVLEVDIPSSSPCHLPLFTSPAKKISISRLTADRLTIFPLPPSRGLEVDSMPKNRLLPCK